jgi:hypothetical protein
MTAEMIKSTSHTFIAHPPQSLSQPRTQASLLSHPVVHRDLANNSSLSLLVIESLHLVLRSGCRCVVGWWSSNSPRWAASRAKYGNAAVHRLSSNEDHTRVDIMVVFQVVLLVHAELASLSIAGCFWSDWKGERGGQAGEDNDCDLHDVECYCNWLGD